MAKFEVISKPEYGITLSQEELDGLYALLNSGCTEATVRLLNLESLYNEIGGPKDPNHRRPGKFRSLAEYSVS